MRNHFLRASGEQVPTKITPLGQASAAWDGTSLTTYTFSSMSIGPASPYRTVVVCVGVEDNAGNGINSMTIGGNSATIRTGRSSPLSGAYTAIATCDIATGTTADIVITFSASVSQFCHIWVGSFLSPSPPTLIDTYTYDVGFIGTASFSDTTTTVADGLLIVAGEVTGSSFTSLSGISQVYQEDGENVNNKLLVANAQTTGASLSWSGASAGSTDGCVVCAASFSF